MEDTQKKADQMEDTRKDCSGTEDEGVDESKKSCSACKTTKTPMWRVGPSGPKTLCNACGIKYKKNQKNEGGIVSSPTRSKSPKKGNGSKSPIKSAQQRKRDKPSSFSRSGGDDSGSGNGNGDLTKDSDPKKHHSTQVMMKMKRQRSKRKFGEVERAAVLLLSLSWGSVSAC